METPFGTWFIAFAAIASLIWNAGNTIYTFRVNRINKARDIRLDEFRTQIRDPMIPVLSKLSELSNGVRALSVSGSPTADIRQEAKELNRQVVSALGDVEERLIDANQSRFVENDGWLADFDIQQKTILDEFNRAANPVNGHDVLVGALSKAGGELAALRRTVLDLCEREIHTLAE